MIRYLSHRSIFLTIMAFALAAGCANASTLIEPDPNTGGAYDTNTGLSWLLTAPDLSYNFVNSNLLGAGNLFSNYRYATGSEVATFFIDAGISPLNTFFRPGSDPRILALISLLGLRGSVADGLTLGSGDAVLVATDVSAAITNAGGWAPDFHSPDLGSFLVTGAFAQTPLPAALPLFATGLGVMGLLGWRRKRKGAAASA